MSDSPDPQTYNPRHAVKLAPEPLSIDPWALHLRCLRHLPPRACVGGGGGAAISSPERPPRSSQMCSCSCSRHTTRRSTRCFLLLLGGGGGGDISRWRLEWGRCTAMWILCLATCYRCASAPLIGFECFTNSAWCLSKRLCLDGSLSFPWCILHWTCVIRADLDECWKSTAVCGCCCLQQAWRGASSRSQLGGKEGRRETSVCATAGCEARQSVTAPSAPHAARPEAPSSAPTGR